MVDELEERYPEFDGLNLTFETREGILKHCSRRNAEQLERARARAAWRSVFWTRTQPSLEAQLCNLADEIAYNAHDIDDGVRSGLITLEQLQEVALFDDFRRQTLAEYPAAAGPAQGRRLLYESIRRMLSAQVYDVIGATQAALQAAAPADADAVRHLPPLVQFSADMRDKSQALKAFLLQNLYRHPQVVETTGQAQQVVRELFAATWRSPTRCPRATSPLRNRQGKRAAARARLAARGGRLHCRHDRPFCLREHERLTGLRLLD